MKKSKKKSRPGRTGTPKILKEVKEMIEDLKEAGMIFSDVARHFHHRVKHASRFLAGAKKHARASKKKKSRRKKRR